MAEEQNTQTETTETPKPAATQSTSGASTKSGNKKTTTIIVVVIVVLIILGYAGSYIFSHFIAKKVGETAAEKILESATGGKVDISSNGDGASVSTKDGSIQTGDKAKWPSDMPSVVPEFKYGNATYSSKTDNANYLGWSVIFDAIQTDASTKYKADLTSKGWTISSTTESSAGDYLSATNGNYTISIVIDQSSKGATLSVNDNSRQ